MYWQGHSADGEVGERTVLRSGRAGGAANLRPNLKQRGTCRHPASARPSAAMAARVSVTEPTLGPDQARATSTPRKATRLRRPSWSRQRRVCRLLALFCLSRLFFLGWLQAEVRQQPSVRELQLLRPAPGLAPGQQAAGPNTAQTPLAVRFRSDRFRSPRDEVGGEGAL